MDSKPGDAKNLRRGFSTGACAAAASKAAWLALKGAGQQDGVEVLFPDGLRHRFKLASLSCGQASAEATVIKDAGDDPDVTDKALVRAKLFFCKPDDAMEKDYLLDCGGSKLIIRGGEGVGLVTRDGVAADKGRWAINPVPRKMILENLRDASFGGSPSCLLACISVDGGELLAKRTLNPVLGIVGGLSILGSSGYVEPYSNEAYVETIRILIRGASLAGAGRLVLCTGSSTLKAAMKLHPGLPECAFIRIADFIADSLRSALSAGFKKATLACMEGKLLKYSSGLQNTHAWKTSQDIGSLRPFLLSAGAEEASLEKAVACASVREAMSVLSPEVRLKACRMMAEKALDSLSPMAPGLELDIDLFGPEGEFMFNFRKGAE